LEQERSCHECEECDLRKVDCTWPKCGNRILAQHRNEHRKSHIISSGIVSFLTAETHSFIVPRDVKKIKVQAWGAGGGSGYLKGQAFGNGGGGAFIEGVVKVFPGEVLYNFIKNSSIDPDNTYVLNRLFILSSGLEGIKAVMRR
jgi:hypothetical protein